MYYLSNNNVKITFGWFINVGVCKDLLSGILFPEPIGVEGVTKSLLSVIPLQGNGVLEKRELDVEGWLDVAAAELLALGTSNELGVSTLDWMINGALRNSLN